MPSCATSQTERHENFILQSITMDVQQESAGLPLNTSHKDWNDYWQNRIRTIRLHPGNERYVRIILESRRSAGLPELR